MSDFIAKMYQIQLRLGRVWGIDRYGTGGTRAPNIWTEGDTITNAPPHYLRSI